MELDKIQEIARERVGRRRFFRTAGVAGLSATAATLFGGGASKLMAQSGDPQMDSATQIFTAALIAEDLATTFYYNGLIGKVIMSPSLAGPGGSATMISPQGNAGNVDYLRAALSEEITHANLLRGLVGISNPGGDPYQTFYFPDGTFDRLEPFLSTLDTLENAFIGAYTIAIGELAALAAYAAARVATGQSAGPFTVPQLEYFAKVAGSILGIESEHRVLGRVISNMNPANNLCFESTDGLTSVYNGPNSAVVALTPFLTSSTGPAYSLTTALAGAAAVDLPCSGGPPPM